MTAKDEFLFDFSINIPRLIIGGNLVIIDNVKRIVLFSEEQIIVHNGKCYTSIEGVDMIISELGEERLIIKGELEAVRFFETL